MRKLIQLHAEPFKLSNISPELHCRGLMPLLIQAAKIGCSLHSDRGLPTACACMHADLHVAGVLKSCADDAVRYFAGLGHAAILMVCMILQLLSQVFRQSGKCFPKRVYIHVSGHPCHGYSVRDAHCSEKTWGLGCSEGYFVAIRLPQNLSSHYDLCIFLPVSLPLSLSRSLLISLNSHFMYILSLSLSLDLSPSLSVDFLRHSYCLCC